MLICLLKIFSVCISITSASISTLYGTRAQWHNSCHSLWQHTHTYRDTWTFSCPIRDHKLEGTCPAVWGALRSKLKLCCGFVGQVRKSIMARLVSQAETKCSKTFSRTLFKSGASVRGRRYAPDTSPATSSLAWLTVSRSRLSQCSINEPNWIATALNCLYLPALTTLIDLCQRLQPVDLILMLMLMPAPWLSSLTSLQFSSFFIQQDFTQLDIENNSS